LDAAVDDVVLQVGDAGDRDEARRPIVERRRPPRVRPTAGTAGHADLLHVHFGPRLQVVERPHAVPGLDPGRRVAAARPPPPAEAIGAVMKSLDLAALQAVVAQGRVYFAD